MDDLIIQGEPIFYAFTLSSKFKELLLVPTSDVYYGNLLFSPRHIARHIEF